MRLRISPLLLVLACTSSEPETPKVTEAPAALSLPALNYRPKPEETAISTAQANLQKLPASPDRWELLATAFIRRGRETADPEYTVLASGLIEEAQKRFPKQARLELLQVMMLLDEHRFREARDLSRTVIQREPENVTALLLLGDAELELGAYHGAVTAYQTAMDLLPDLRSYNRGAYLRWLHGDFDGAVEMMELALDAGSPTDPEPRAWCYVDLARLYFHKGDLDRATKALDFALGLMPSYAAALSLKARVHAAKGEHYSAIPLLEQAIEKKADTSDLLLLSELSSDPKKREAALARANKLGEHDPRPLAHHLARHSLEPVRALELAKKALDDRPTIEAQDTFALAALRAGKLPEATAAIERAMALGTIDGEIWLHRALIEQAAGKKAEAKKSLARALELNPKADPLLISEARRVIR